MWDKNIQYWLTEALASLVRNYFVPGSIYALSMSTLKRRYDNRMLGGKSDIEYGCVMYIEKEQAA